jgi:hypothetical protein
VEPGEFTRVVVIGDEDGRADYTLREDVRRMFEFVTGIDTDSASFEAMPQVRHVATNILELDGALPRPLTGVV